VEILLVRAPNPSPYTLDGTNTYVVGRDPAWVIDPGPALDEHLDALEAAVAERGGAGGVALTHDHLDHAEAIEPLRARLGDVPLGRFPALADGDPFGPLTAYHVPGHAPDHLVFVDGADAFTGDAVLGIGSVLLMPDGGGLGPYLEGLRRLRALGVERLHPGHGPEVGDGDAKLEEYIAHRLERERRIVAALDAGVCGEDALIDAAWDEVPEGLRGAALWTLQVHLEKLRAEGRAP
jgi:glyoxylase-like metal-dependent hydrolase (beta-lactamase superfamily II)